MPPPKSSYTHDVNDVLAPVQGGVTFLQESVVDVDCKYDLYKILSMQVLHGFGLLFILYTNANCCNQYVVITL